MTEPDEGGAVAQRRSGLVTRLLDRLPERLARYVDMGALPDDSENERLRKASLVLTSSVISVAALLWVAVYGTAGLWWSAAIPLGYSIASWFSLGRYAATKRFVFFRSSQLLLMLVLPFLLQWSLGGFRSGSAVTLWAVFAPLGALIFVGRRAPAWLLAYVGLTVLFGFLDARIAASGPPVPPAIVATFFVLNLATVAAIVYLLVRYFVGEQELAQQRSERLLLNVLPRAIAERLKRDPSAIADGFAEVTVLFADIVDFTPFSARIAPQRLVALLNDVFSAFDHLADRHGLEKIKTIGDAYMAVGGLPVPRPDHAEAAAEMALEMHGALRRAVGPPGAHLRLRIGIHTGPVVAGVIGRRKFIYDLWGDTVNTASRMESLGLPGAIQVSAETHERLRDAFVFEERGTIEVKGKGPMRTYLLIGRRAAPAVPA